MGERIEMMDIVVREACEAHLAALAKDAAEAAAAPQE